MEPKIIIKAALWLLEMDFENFQTKYYHDGKQALKGIKRYLEQYLLSKNDRRKLDGLIQALQAIKPYLTPEALVQLERYLKSIK